MNASSTEIANKVGIDLKGVISEIQRLRVAGFTGKLVIESIDNNACFALVFRLGRLTWLSSNIDPARYWRRQLIKYQPDLPQDWLAIVADYRDPWVSATELADAMIEGAVDRQQLTAALTAVAIEVFFDLIQLSKLLNIPFVCTSTAQGEQETNSEDTQNQEGSRSMVFLPMNQ